MPLREVLCECVQEYGLDALTQRNRAVGLVADRLPGHRRDRWLVTVCLEARVVDGLLVDMSTRSQERLIGRLVNDFAVESDAATYVVNALIAAIRASRIPPVDAGEPRVPQSREVLIARWATCLAAAVGGLGVAIAARNAAPATAGAWALLAAVLATSLVFQQFLRLSRRLSPLDDADHLREVVRQLAALQPQVSRADARHAADFDRVQVAKARLVKHNEATKQDTPKWQKQLASRQEARDNAWRDAEKTECGHLHTKESELRDRIASHRLALANCERSFDMKVAERVRIMRQPFVAAALRNAELTDAEVDGLGEHGLSRLAAAGYRTAYDVLHGAPESVFGLGQKERSGLRTWAQGVAETAERMAPTDLADDIKRSLLAEHDTLLARLRSEIDTREEQLVHMVASKEKLVSAARARIDHEFHVSSAAADQERNNREQAARRREDDLTRALQAAERVHGESIFAQQQVRESMNLLVARRDRLARRHNAATNLTLGSFLRAVMRFRD